VKKGTSLYLDLVRFGAALAVVAEHFRERTRHLFDAFWGLYPRLSFYLEPLSHTAVAVFFVLSGYVIAHVMETRERTIIEFAASRFGRLYSVVVPALVLTAATNTLEVIAYPGFLDRVPITHSGISPTMYYLGTAIFVNHIWLWPNLEPPNLIAFWSLTFEVAYYIAIALFVFTEGKTRVLGLAILGAVSGPAVVLLAPTWLLGYCVYRIADRVKTNAGVSAFMWFGSIFLLMLCPLLNSGPPKYISMLNMPDPSLGHLLNAYATAICFAINIVACNGISLNLKRILQPFSKLIRWLGSLTFALYLFHAPLLSFFLVYSLHDRASPAQALYMIGGTLFLVATLGRFCEQSKGTYKRLLLTVMGRTTKPSQTMG
jgi:peptidoglycan/LPS O-acetylase OafA/YrhL